MPDLPRGLWTAEYYHVSAETCGHSSGADHLWRSKAPLFTASMNFSHERNPKMSTGLVGELRTVTTSSE